MNAEPDHWPPLAVAAGASLYFGPRRASMAERWALRLGLNVTISAIAAVLMLLSGSGSAAIPTNPPAQFIVKDGPAQSLERPWLGNARLTVQTGSYASNQSPPEIRKLNEQIRFDLVMIGKERTSNNPSLMLSRSCGQAHMIEVHSYREKLPTDTEIKACKTISQLTTLLGFPDWADGAPYNAQWRRFTVDRSNTVETLTVFCTALHWERGEGPPDSLEIWRGSAREDR